MKFYEIDEALKKAIYENEKPVSIKIELEIEDTTIVIHERHIIEANFYGLKEVSGGTTSRGELLIENPNGIYDFEATGLKTKVKISFSMGEGLPYLERFVLYTDDNGIQNIRGEGRKRFIYLSLRDLSERLRKTDETKDWSSNVFHTYSVVCDKSQPEKSLLHKIAKRAGIDADDIDCATIPVTIPFVKITKNVWTELSNLASAYRCHLECAPEKTLVFSHSPYQDEAQTENDISYTFTGSDIFYLRKTERLELYKNTVRLKINVPVTLERQEIWRYDEAPVFYDDNLRAQYSFTDPLKREIEFGNYEANYKVKEENGKERNVIFADEIDTKDEAEARLEYDGGSFSYTQYDVTSNSDKAVLQLTKQADSVLYIASIFGRPIVYDINRSFFLRDENEINKHGRTVALNVTGSYFSQDVINGEIHYQDWVKRELAERLEKKREFTVKTHRALFYARIGASVEIITKDETMSGLINEFSFQYKKDEAFVSTFKIRGI